MIRIYPRDEQQQSFLAKKGKVDRSVSLTDLEGDLRIMRNLKESEGSTKICRRDCVTMKLYVFTILNTTMPRCAADGLSCYGEVTGELVNAIDALK